MNHCILLNKSLILLSNNQMLIAQYSDKQVNSVILLVIILVALGFTFWRLSR